MKKGLGLVREIPDRRDYPLSAKGVIKDVVLPESVDLRLGCPSITDQKTTSSCTGHAVSALCEYVTNSQLAPNYTPSVLFLYYCTRSLEGTADVDAGASMRATLKAVNTFGVATDESWPFNVKKINEQPPEEAYESATFHQSLQYERVPLKLFETRYVLSLGSPFVFGFSVYSDFTEETGNTGIAKLPKSHESLEGGHAVMCAGYSDEDRMFIIRNSWGDWGQGGYFFMPYEFLTDRTLAFDAWRVIKMERGIEL